MKQDSRTIAFFVYPVLQFPLNNREYYLTEEITSRGWRAIWLVPKSGKNEGVPIEKHIMYYQDLNVRGRTYIRPIYLGLLLRARRIRYLWISGWSIRADREIYWLVRIMRIFGIETIYDPIDPKCLFEAACDKDLVSSPALLKSQRTFNKIYGMCTQVLCVTPEMKTLMIEKGADTYKLFVARWGCDRKLFNRSNIKGSLRKRLNIDKSAVLVGWLGNMSEFKGLKETLLPLIEKLVERKGFHFLIAGDGPLFNEVEAWVTLRNDRNITLLGALPYAEAPLFTASLDIYLVTTDPSSEYAKAICPVKCYDAIALETPLVTTRTPATEHLTGLSGKVILCDYNIESFEKAVLDIVANNETVSTSREQGPAELISHQSVSKEIADMLDKFASTHEC